MNVSLVQAAAAMNANARWQEVIAQNLSAGYIPGFKKQDLSFAAVQAGYMSSTHPGSPGSVQRFLLPAASAATNFQPGELKPTGVATDLAIDGPGFFEVQLADGSRAYTRGGEFKANARGQLCTNQGSLVMGDAGPLQFDPSNSAPITVSPTGEVSQGVERRGTLKLVDFAEPRRLTVIGAGLFQANDPTLLPQPAAAARVRQGFLEAANTFAVTEMGNLITALRMYEANEKVIQIQDDRMGRAIADLGNPS